MTADDKFKKIGYELVDEKICPHSYKYIKNIDKFNIKEIILQKDNKLITICYYKIDIHKKIEPLNLIEYHLTVQELKAVNQKYKELGWLDE